MNACMQAVEAVKIQRQHTGQTDLQQRDIIGQETQYRIRQHLECAHDERGDNQAACHVAEVTERHGDRRCDLAEHVERRHDEDRLEEPLQVALDAAVLDLIERDQHERDERPAKRGVQVCRVVERIQNRLASEPNSELIISVIMYGEKA